MIQPGTVIDGKYRVDRTLGEGGMAIVFAATHLDLNQMVAVKVLLPGLAGNAMVVERFLREAKAAVRLKGQHVVRVLDVGTLPSSQPFIVMEHLDGKDLEQVLKERGKLPPGETVDYVLQVCEALAEAHGAGIVHRDIKPANCVLTHRNDGMPSIKVLDFGIAKMTLADGGPALTATTATMGTPAFMSPEQIRGAKDVDHRGDIWSLGIMLFELMMGHVPFHATTYAKLVMTVMRDPVPPMRGVPPELEAVLHHCLVKDREQRFQHVADLARALEPFAGDRNEAMMIAQRCASLGRAAQQVRTATPATGVPAHGARGAAPSPLNTPSHGAPALNTPPHGAPALNTPPHGAPALRTPPHGAPALRTPPQAVASLNAPTHGAPPAPGYGVSPVAGPHGAPRPGYGVAPVTPPHGVPIAPGYGVSPVAPSHGYPSQPPHQGYPTQPPHQAYPTQPPHQAYPTQPPHQAYPTQPPHQAYQTQPPHQAYQTQPPHQAYQTQPPHQAYSTHTSPTGNAVTSQSSPALTQSGSANPAPVASGQRSRRVLWFIVIGIIAGSVAGLVLLLT